MEGKGEGNAWGVGNLRAGAERGPEPKAKEPRADEGGGGGGGNYTMHLVYLVAKQKDRNLQGVAECHA